MGKFLVPILIPVPFMYTTFWGLSDLEFLFWFGICQSYLYLWRLFNLQYVHYNDVIMSAMASQITSLTIVHSSVYSGADQRKHQSYASLAFVRGFHRWVKKVWWIWLNVSHGYNKSWGNNNCCNTLRPRQNGRHFPDDICKRIVMNKNCCILMKVSLKFVPQLRLDYLQSNTGSDNDSAPARRKTIISTNDGIV